MNSLNQLLVVSNRDDFVHNINQLLTSDETDSEPLEINVCHKTRAAKKALKEKSVVGILFDLSCSQSLSLSTDLLAYVRDGLNDQQRIMIGIGDTSNIDTAMTNKLDYTFDADTYCQATLQKIIQRESRVCLENSRAAKRQEIETDLLASIAQFSRQELPLNLLLRDFSDRTKALISADSSLCIEWNDQCQAKFHHLVKNKEDTGSSTNDNSDGSHGTDEFHRLMQTWVTSDNGIAVLNATANSHRPHIELLEKAESDALNGLSGLLIFPIRRFSKTLRILLFPLTDTSATEVSLHTVNVLSKASEQLSIVVERRFAGKKLAAQYKRTKDTLFELAQAKEQLVQKEKMASIGQLAAGVAHEINNPLSFVLSNLGPMEEYVDEFKTLFELHDQLLENISATDEVNTSAIIKDIRKKKIEADQEFILEDLRSIVNESRNGLLRVKDIISDLRAFAREETTQLEQQNVKQLVDETLYFMKHEISEKIALTVDVSNDIQVLVHHGYVRQVLTNLIKNACDALMDDDKDDKKIVITVEQTAADTIVKIRDNGPGIPTDVLSKIYDPFFTTKPIGEGTGLGLSITHKLMDAMNGSIKCNSVVGQHTEFVLTFPNRS